MQGLSFYVAVKSREEFEPFIELNYEEFVNHNIALATPTRFELAISALTGQYVSRYTTGPRTTTTGGRYWI